MSIETDTSRCAEGRMMLLTNEALKIMATALSGERMLIVPADNGYIFMQLLV